MGIVVIGESFHDTVGLGDYEDEMVVASYNKVRHMHGGAGRNIAENLGNMEQNPLFISQVGTDDFSKRILEKLQNHRVNTQFVGQCENGLGEFMVIYDQHLKRISSAVRLPNTAAMDQILDQYGDMIFRNASCIALELSSTRSILKKVFSLAAKHRKPVYGAIANVHEAIEWRDLFDRLDCLVCNQQEAQIIFGHDFHASSNKEIAKMMPELIRKLRIRRLVITTGAQGCVWGEIKNVGICEQEKVKVKSRLGAGDAFFAGLVAGLNKGKSLKTACEIGNKMAASKLRSEESVVPRINPEWLGL